MLIVREAIEYELITDPRKLYMSIGFTDCYILISIGIRVYLEITGRDLSSAQEYIFMLKPVVNYTTFYNFHRAVKKGSLVKSFS